MIYSRSTEDLPEELLTEKANPYFHALLEAY
jgi:hypothetical protein